MAGGWRVGFRRVVAGRVEVGLLVPTAPAVLVPGRPMAPGRETWTAVAAAAVVYLRVVAGATVVAVVVVTVVVKSLGIQSGTQQNAGGGWCFATLSGGRESCSDFGGEMPAKKLTLRLLHTQKKSPPTLARGQPCSLADLRARCGHMPFFPRKISVSGLSA